MGVNAAVADSAGEGATRRADVVCVLFFFSGLAGLIYESVWSHYVKLFLGHAAYAQTLVLIVFIGGLALGSWLCARIAEKIANPLLWYAAVEGAIGLAALTFHWIFVRAIEWGYGTLLPATCDASSAFCFSQWALSALLLAPQSILLGATFPLVTSAVLRMRAQEPGRDIATLYFLNSLGAVMGVLASVFLLIPAVGLPGTLMTAGVANLVIAMTAYYLAKAPVEPLAVARIDAAAQPQGLAEGRLVKLLLATALLTGLSSFIYEIVWIRMLSLVLGASTHSFELMLASFILGLALGGAWIRNRMDVGADAVRLLGYVQLAMGFFALASIVLYNGTFDLMAWLLSALARNEGGFVLFNIASTAISLLVMLPATFCAGMTLPLITYRLLRSRTGERSLGMVYAFNTLGSIAGVIVAVHLLMTHLGIGPTLMVGAAIDVLLGAVLLVRWNDAGQARRIPAAAVAVMVAFALLSMVTRIDPVRAASGVFRTGIARLPQNSKVLFHQDGKTATVDVIASESSLSIRTNGKSDAAFSFTRNPLADEFTMTLLALLPMAHNPQAKTAAAIGFGSGTSTAMLLASPRIERVDTIEIEPAMVEGARHFRPLVEPAYTDKRSHIVIDDAKSYFARGGKRYDIIVSEPSNPWVSGVASLFTEEFYRRLALSLNDGGVLSQWLHPYEMDAQTFASILSALQRTFPDFVLYMPHDGDIVVIARKGGPVGAFDPQVLGWPGLRPMLERLYLTDAEVVRRRAVASSTTLKPYFATYNATPNSDYFPVVDQRASRTRFTHANVTDLADLQRAPVPMLEMLDGTLAPLTQPHALYPVTVSERIGEDAWGVYGMITGTLKRSGWGSNTTHETAGRMVQQWAAHCPADWTFDDVRPSMVGVAELNPQLRSDFAAAMWQPMLDSRCARALSAEERRWVELFHAVARRDGARMAALGSAILSTRMPVEAASEYAFLAAATGYVCIGQAEKARELLNESARWVRADERKAERRFLGAIVSGPSAAQAARCR